MILNAYLLINMQYSLDEYLRQLSKYIHLLIKYELMLFLITFIELKAKNIAYILLFCYD